MAKDGKKIANPHGGKKSATHKGGMHDHHKHVEQTAGKLHGNDPYKHQGRP